MRVSSPWESVLIFFTSFSRRISEYQGNRQRNGGLGLNTLFAPTLIYWSLKFWQYNSAPSAELAICDIVCQCPQSHMSNMLHLPGRFGSEKNEYGHIMAEYLKFTYIFRLRTRLQEDVICAVWCIRPWLWLVVMVVMWGWPWRGGEGNTWKSMSCINK